MHFGIDRLRRDPPKALLVLLVGFGYQFTVVVAAWLGAEALGLPLGFNALLAFFPVVAIAQVLPVSIGGLGLREGALVSSCRTPAWDRPPPKRSRSGCSYIS